MAAWLRLDDTFAEHPKIVALSLEDAWRWVQTLLYCARRREDGVLSIAQLTRVCGWEDEALDWLLELGLLDEHETSEDGSKVASYRVHDWHVYNGAKSDAERKREERARKYGADYTGKPVDNHGGRRGEYGSVASSHGTVTGQERDESVSIARAGSPSPSPKNSSTQTEAKGAGSDDLAFGIELELARLMQAVGDCSEQDRDTIRGLARRSREATVARLRESLEAGAVRDRVAYAITTLRNELEGVTK